MASASTRTRTPRLVLHRSSRTATSGDTQLRLSPSARLIEFLQAAAQAGLDAPLAVRLALQRALVLHDAQELRLDAERICRTLNRAASEVRATQPLSAQQAAYVRQLSGGRPRPVITMRKDLAIVVPDDLLTQVRGTVPETALHQSAVRKMLAWERAAKLGGRTMMEWALKTLATLLAEQ